MGGREHYGREASPGEEHLQEALLRRAQRAVDAATEIVARSRVISLVSTELRPNSLTCRCAWCGRYRVGHDHWFTVEPSARIDLTDTTHGICDACVAALREAGLSA